MRACHDVSSVFLDVGFVQSKGLLHGFLEGVTLCDVQGSCLLPWLPGFQVSSAFDLKSEDRDHQFMVSVKLCALNNASPGGCC